MIMFDTLETHEVQVYRREDEGYINHNHEWVPAEFSSPISIKCSVQPLGEGKKKIILPDGVRTDEALVLRTRYELKGSDNYETYEGDIVEYGGYTYEIFTKSNWTGFGLPSDHFKYILKRVDES